MDIGKLKGLSIGDLTARAQALAEKLAPTDPEFASDLALSLVKGLLNGNEDLSGIVSLFGNDEDISGGLFPEEPVTVTKTTTSVGNVPPADLGGTPEEKEMLNLASDQASDDDKLYNLLTNPDSSDADIDAALAELYPEDNKAPADLGSTPEEKALLDQAVKNAAESKADAPAEEPKKEEPKADKPAEEPKKTDKPADKPAEDKSDSKKEDKQEQSDTDRNIISTLSDLK